MSAKMWEVTVEHAQTCGLGEQMYVYYPSTNMHKMGVVFNVVCQVLGVLSDGHIIPLDRLSETEKVSYFSNFNHLFMVGFAIYFSHYIEMLVYLFY